MTPAALTLAGKALFGPRWKIQLAQTIGVSRETVSRWVNGHQAIPLWAAKMIRLLVQEKGTVLSLCDRTGNMVRPWAEAGFECLCVDIQHTELRREGSITYIGADISAWLPPPRRYAIVFASPPCSHLAVSGRAWFRDKGLSEFSEDIALVEASRRICEWAEAPWMLENPVGTLSSYWRAPDYLFNPCDYGGYLEPPSDAYTKKTCLWTGNGFVMPKKKPVEPVEGSKLHRLPPSPDRGDKRSVTPKGFAKSVMLANVEVIAKKR